MNYEVKLKLEISGFNQNPELITNYLEIQPSKYWKIGDKISSRGTLTYKVNGWELSSSISDKDDFQVHLNDIIKIIKEKKDKFIDLCNKYDSVLFVVIYIYHSLTTDEVHNTPWIHFDIETIKLLSQIGSEIDIDIYVLPV